jgi:hypothetical protein
MIQKYFTRLDSPPQDYFYHPRFILNGLLEDLSSNSPNGEPNPGAAGEDDANTSDISLSSLITSISGDWYLQRALFTVESLWPFTLFSFIMFRIFFIALATLIRFSDFLQRSV